MFVNSINDLMIQIKIVKTKKWPTINLIIDHAVIGRKEVCFYYTTFILKNQKKLEIKNVIS